MGDIQNYGVKRGLRVGIKKDKGSDVRVDSQILGAILFKQQVLLKILQAERWKMLPNKDIL